MNTIGIIGTSGNKQWLSVGSSLVILDIRIVKIGIISFLVKTLFFFIYIKTYLFILLNRNIDMAKQIAISFRKQLKIDIENHFIKYYASFYY